MSSEKRKSRVLVVDDQPDCAEVVSVLLTIMGYECQSAGTGSEALEQAEKFEPDVVLLDLHLPDVSGYEVARELRRRAGKRPLHIAAVSGSSTPDGPGPHPRGRLRSAPRQADRRGEAPPRALHRRPPRALGLTRTARFAPSGHEGTLRSASWRRCCSRCPTATSTSPRSRCRGSCSRGRPRGRVRHREAAARSPAADPLLLTGVLFGQLGAAPSRRRSTRSCERRARVPRAASRGRRSTSTSSTRCSSPGGHAPGMRQYLGSEALQGRSRAFWALDRPVGAICHGVLARARGRRARTARASSTGDRTTCLPKYMERTAYFSPRGSSAATTARIRRTSRTRCAPRSRGPADFVRGPRDAVEARHRRPTTRPRSWSRTAATSRRAGPATRTSSRRS